MSKIKLSEIIRNLKEEEIPGFKRFYSKLLMRFGVSSRGSIRDPQKLQAFDNAVTSWKEKNTPAPEPETPRVPEVEQVEKEGPEVKETSNTGGAEGYLIPQAFSPDGKITAKQKHIATLLGMELVKTPDSRHTEEHINDELDRIDEMLTESFYFKDENLSPQQKIGLAMRQVRNHLTEVEKIVSKSIRLKNESGTAADNYGKRTYQALRRINEKVVRLMVALNDMKN